MSARCEANFVIRRRSIVSTSETGANTSSIENSFALPGRTRWDCLFMHSSVAARAKRHEVFFGVLAELAARFEMLDLQMFRATTGLAALAITA